MDVKLTTHVLDTSHGKPAAGMKIELRHLESQGWLSLKTVTTNKDGRTDEPLLTGAEFRPGQYELLFYVGEFFAHVSGDTVKPRFLDVVPIRFGVSMPVSSYHVPLLCSRWSYSTYRGS